MGNRIIEVAPHRLQDMTPVGVLETEAGTSFGERFTVKNWAANPKKAREYLRGLGYDVRPWNNGFVVRKDLDDPWRPVDPSGGADFGFDILDLVGDAMVGVIGGLGTVAGAAVGSAPGAVAGGLAGGAAGEALRQGIGSAAGIPNNQDTMQVGVSGALNAALPLAGRALGGVARGTASALSSAAPGSGQLALEMGARVAGIKGFNSAGIPAYQVLKEFATAAGEFSKRTGRPVSEFRTPAFESVAKVFQKFVHNATEEIIPENRMAETMIGQARESGMKVNMQTAVAELREFLQVARAAEKNISFKKLAGMSAQQRARAGLFRDVDVGARTPFGLGAGKKSTADRLSADDSLTDLIERAITRMNEFTFSDRPLGTFRSLDVDQALKLKKLLQGVADDANAFAETGGGPVQSSFAAIMKRASGSVRESLEKHMEAGGFTEYTGLMRTVGFKMGRLRQFQRLLKGTPRVSEAEQAENFVRTFYGRGRGTSLEALRDLERYFGNKGLVESAEAEFGEQMGLEQAIRLAAVGSRIGPQGAAGMMPRIAATGQIIGTGLLGGGAAFGAGFPLGAGAAAGAALGAYLASPRNVIRITAQGIRMAPRIAEGLQKGAAFGASNLTEFGVTLPGRLAVSAMGRARVTEDSPRSSVRRRTALILGE